MSQSIRLTAFFVWTTMALFAVAGFAAFSPVTETGESSTSSGRLAGGVAALAFHGSLLPSLSREPIPTEAARWESTVRKYFAEQDVERALSVVFCESSGNPDAKNISSTATGLFQHLPKFWSERSDRAGFPGADIRDPDANAAVAAWLVYNDGGWRHWYPSAGCWAAGSMSLG